MANGKYPWILGALVVVYAGWVALSGFLAHATNLPWAVRDQKVAILDHPRTVNGLIVGGSNASFGLSAELMTQLSGKRWFNASLMGEGFTLDNQTDFLNDVAGRIYPNEVELIVVSSIRHVKKMPDDRWLESDISFDGSRQSPAWMPIRSLANFAINPRWKFYGGLINDFGDLDHDVADVCRPGVGAAPVRWASVKQSAILVNSWLTALTAEFPQAEIIIAIPTKYIDAVVPETETSEYVDRLYRQIDEWRRDHDGSIDARVSVLVEDNVTDRSLVCNTSHHFNAAGREVRTRALVDALEARTTDNR